MGITNILRRRISDHARTLNKLNNLEKLTNEHELRLIALEKEAGIFKPRPKGG